MKEKLRKKVKEKPKKSRKSAKPKERFEINTALIEKNQKPNQNLSLSLNQNQNIPRISQILQIDFASDNTN